MNMTPPDVRWRLVFAIALGALLGIYAANALARAKALPVSVVIEHGPILPHKGTARLRVTVEPQATNRGLWTAIEASGYAAAHYEQIDGASAPKSRWVEFKDLPDGNYTAWIRLLKDHGEISASVTFTVGYDETEFP